MALSDYYGISPDPEERKRRQDAWIASLSPLDYCPIAPWVNELCTRFQEATAAGTNVLNLSLTHPRGFFPRKILFRREVREILAKAKEQGWLVDNKRYPIPTYPAHNVFTVPGITDLNYCDTKPFEDEIELRRQEGVASIGFRFADCTAWHPRGEIPSTIMKRLQRREDSNWRSLMEVEISKLLSQANKDEAFAETQESRAEGVASRNEGTGDPTALLQAVANLRERARVAREQIKYYRWEMGVR